MDIFDAWLADRRLLRRSRALPVTRIAAA